MSIVTLQLIFMFAIIATSCAFLASNKAVSMPLRLAKPLRCAAAAAAPADKTTFGKGDLIAALREKTGLPKKTVTTVFEETINIITEQVLTNRKSVTVTKFGSFTPRFTKARDMPDRFSKAAKAGASDLKFAVPSRMYLGFSPSPATRVAITDEAAGSK